METTRKISAYAGPKTYPSRYTANLLTGPVTVEEKIDGSQLSFLRTADDQLLFKSRGEQFTAETAQQMFKPTVDHLLSVMHKIPQEVIFRGEALQRPRHNKLAYSRAPKGHFVLYDVEIGYIELLDKVGRAGIAEYCQLMAEELGVEPARVFFEGDLTKDALLELWERVQKEESILGGPIEGIVVKNRNQANDRGLYPLSGKLVTSSFKERMNKPLTEKATAYAVPQPILDSLNFEAIWDKAIIHLGEKGALAGSMQDTPSLMREISKDFEEENKEMLEKELYTFYRKNILKYISRGFPEYYRSKLEAEEDPK